MSMDAFQRFRKLVEPEEVKELKSKSSGSKKYRMEKIRGEWRHGRGPNDPVCIAASMGKECWHLKELNKKENA